MTELENFFADIKHEFGCYGEHDFDKVTSIPMGFQSKCWHNDSCPSITYEKWHELEEKYPLSTIIWIESADEMNRELNWGTQFSLNVSCCERSYAYDSDDWQDIVDHAPKAIELQELIAKDDTFDGFDKYAEKAKEYGFKYQ